MYPDWSVAPARAQKTIRHGTSLPFRTPVFADLFPALRRLLLRALRAKESGGEGPACAVLGVSGPSSVGKTNLFIRPFASYLESRGREACVAELDGYLFDKACRQALGLSGYDPAACDGASLAADVRALHSMKAPVMIPRYDHATGGHLTPAEVAPTPILILDGILSQHQAVRTLVDVSLFIDVPESLRHRFRLERALKLGAHTEEELLRNAARDTAAYRRCVEPRREMADIVVHIDADRHIERVSGRLARAFVPHGIPGTSVSSGQKWWRSVT